MKKTIIFTATLIIFTAIGTTSVQAQETTKKNLDPKSAEPTLVNIILADVISLEHGPGALAKDVTFEYNTAEQYNTNQNIVADNALWVTSSRGFQLEVEAKGTHFVGEGTTDKIPVGVMDVHVTSGTALPKVNLSKSVTLKTTPQVLLVSGVVGAQKTVGITYTIPALQAQTHLIGKDPKKYKQQVVYTATSK